MTAKIIDGTAIAEQVRAGLLKEVEARIRGGIATPRIGNSPGG